MIIAFTKGFEKSLTRIRDKKIADTLLETIENLKLANNPFQIKNLKKLKGHPTAYRIRVGNYRIGVFIENNAAAFCHS
jgi:mRNA interferase RelE/StbE